MVCTRIRKSIIVLKKHCYVLVSQICINQYEDRTKGGKIKTVKGQYFFILENPFHGVHENMEFNIHFKETLFPLVSQLYINQHLVVSISVAFRDFSISSH